MERKNLKLNYFTTGHPTNLEGLSMAQLIELHYAKLSKKQNTVQILQTIHNIYARKLNIPAVSVIKEDCSNDSAYFTQSYSKRKNNVSIEVDKYIEIILGILVSYTSIIHETKHAQHLYNLHKYKYHGVVPKSNYEKAIALFGIFTERRKSCEKCCYYAKLNELDAYIFELEEMGKLIEGSFNDGVSIARYYEEILYFMSKLSYTREGVNNKFLRIAYKALKTDIYELKSNPELAEAIAELLEDFDIDDAFKTLENKINSLYDILVCSMERANSQGKKIPFESYGLIRYDKNLFLRKNKRLLDKYLEFIREENEPEV